MYRKERVQGYEEYQVDTNGVVYSKKGRPLRYSVSPRGYAIINFTIQGKRIGFGVHTLVAQQFLGAHPVEKNQVNHIDGNKLNNHVMNLEWTTPRENMQHAITVLGFHQQGAQNPGAKSVYAFDPITRELVLSYDSLADAARALAKLGENFRYIQNRICQAAKGHRKKYRGLFWRYAPSIAT